MCNTIGAGNLATSWHIVGATTLPSTGNRQRHKLGHTGTTPPNYHDFRRFEGSMFSADVPGSVGRRERAERGALRRGRVLKPRDTDKPEQSRKKESEH